MEILRCSSCRIPSLGLIVPAASRPGECTSGTAVTFGQARAAFESAWRVFLSKRTEADFQAWRNRQAWTAENYRRFDRGERMPHDWRAIGTPV
jgi:hypothetical protein